ncbi:hypothetical protein HPT25_04715 [Bacillus sp. BRMEA1]|uniref:hypothetical protein n=1 Tax=Neobacillus endophyticus TaxID=2738405 RepID=UPI0015639502|nr:hypothetical protein [Neobacillus endophyticus]NRD76793.1 hypothetical protein [Neobacillus endophyticus]
MSKRKILSICTLIIPWLTAPLIGKNTFIRFLPVATFIGYIFGFISEIADNRKWWKVKNALFPKYHLDISYLFGLYFIVTIWVFKLTFGNFYKYLTTNIVIDLVFSYPIVKFFTKVGVFEFKKMQPKDFCIISILMSIFIYFYQTVVERVIVKEKIKEQAQCE